MHSLLPLLFLSPAAQAQSETPPPRVEYRQETELTEDDFRALEVDGELVGPGDILIAEVERKPFPPWMRLRTDFDDHLQASLDEVR